MITRQVKSILLIGITLIIGVAACKDSNAGLSTVTHTPVNTITPQPIILSTPYAQEPAAGICASFEGEVVTINLFPDIPAPRCSQVRPDQILTVNNRTQVTLEISIGSFKDSLEPGASTRFDTQFGDYLAPGVHQLQVTPCCGAELWLEEK
jgi:hypothetical protein